MPLWLVAIHTCLTLMLRVHFFITKVSSGAKFTPSGMVCWVHREQRAPHKALHSLSSLCQRFLMLLCHDERINPVGWRPAAGDLRWWVQGIFSHLACVHMRLQSTGEQLCCCSGFTLEKTSEKELGKSSLGRAGGQFISPQLCSGLLCPSSHKKPILGGTSESSFGAGPTVIVVSTKHSPAGKPAPKLGKGLGYPNPSTCFGNPSY